MSGMNNGLLTERAHLGLFQSASYVSIGDPYGKKASKDPRFGGKQFSSKYPISGISGGLPANAYFSVNKDKEGFPNRDWMRGEKYIDRTMYLTTQPPDQRKKGFYSSDAKRRDEFTLEIETAKWRERIGTEMIFAEQARKMQEAKMTDEEREEADRLARIPPEPRWTHGPKYLFDVGKEVAGGTTPYQPKDKRDTWFSRQRVASENSGLLDTGSYLLSSHAVGSNLKDYHDWTKPEHARQPIIRDSFFRSTGVLRSVTWPPTSGK